MRQFDGRGSRCIASCRIGLLVVSKVDDPITCVGKGCLAVSVPALIGALRFTGCHEYGRITILYKPLISGRS